MESDDDFNLTSDDDDNYAMNTINVNPITDNQHEFEVLGPEDIVKHMSDYIEDVNTIVQISATTTRILLQHFKWDKQKLLEKYFDNDNLENLFHEAHIINPFAQLSVEHKNTTSDLDKCRICFSYCPPDYTTSLKCAHRFCNTCWRIYLSTKIMDDGLGQSISCPGHQCDILVDDVTIMTLITEPCIKFKYQVAITNSFVECNRLWRWCPAVDCKNAVKVQYIDSSPVQCRCGHIFCFECGENWHPSVQCRLLKKWITRYDSTLLWIAVNTKECPKCNVTIIKDGGCNHIECKNQNCAHEFCWVCLDPWQEHVSSSFNCNRYNEEVVKAAQSLTRYNHYNSRYMNHMNSLKFENLLYSAVKAKMEEMQEHNLSAIEEEFLKKSVDMLCLCRRTLMYTYVFAYYLCRNNQSMIFEYNQRDLESATESLSGYLERDITPENLAEIKQKIHHKYGYCESRRKVLLDHVHEGYDKEWWIYTESIK